MSASKAPTACRPSPNKHLLLFAQAFFAATTVFAQDSRDIYALDAIAGKALFERIWVTAPGSTAAADGLGPYYDARNCAACHPAAGAGTVPDSLTLVLDDPVYGRQLQRHAVAGLPAEAAFDVQTEVIASSGTVVLQRLLANVRNLQSGPLTSPFSLRRPPALAGVARFDEVEDATLEALADPLDRDDDGISGRVAGRYGWKAETATLEQQIGKAFSIDIGISNPQFPAPGADCTAAQLQCLAHADNSGSAATLDANEVVLQLVVQYLGALPQPPASTDDSEGRALFAGFGCAACHVETLDTASSPLRAWTDLLLHDMGPGLAGGPPSATASESEWRTAPLWGMAGRQALLHDGRARNIEEAILWHGGEAEASRLKFANAGEDQQLRLQAFLLGL